MLLMVLSTSAGAQTTDGGFDRTLSASPASTATAMFATIRRDLGSSARL
jgi:hypothetical protein